MGGVHPSWHTTDLLRAQIVSKVGDALFKGLFWLLVFYAMAPFVALVLVTGLTGTIPLDNQKPSVIAALWAISALVPGVLLFPWISRRPRAPSPF
jgi:hypothetical protein